MIDTKTTWEDSGYDCDHCGGQIFQRTDYETGRAPRICYQCRACGCQWTMDGTIQRIGSLPSCKVAGRRRVRAEERGGGLNVPRWVWVVATILFLLVALRFGGLAALRFLVPLALAALAARYAYQLGREREWW